MKFKQKAGHLAGVLALFTVMYIPQTSASPLVVPSPLNGDSFNILNISGGDFTENYNFSVASDALFSFTGGSTDTLGTGALVFITNGASLKSVDLLDTTSHVDTSAQLTRHDVNIVSPLNSLDGYTQSTYSASLGGIVLNASDSYQLVFTGSSRGSNGNVTGTIFLSTPPAITAVPLPSATWLFLSGLMGFLGLNKSRKANKAA